MSARIQNVPLYVIFDRSPGATYSLTGTHLNGTTGQTSYLFDGNLATSYDILTAGGLLQGQEATFIIDYGKLFFNCQFSYSSTITYNRDTGAGTASWEIYYSEDGITYTLIDSGSLAAGASVNSLQSKTFLAMRYVKFHILTPNSGNISNSTIAIKECRLMGSGS